MARNASMDDAAIARGALILEDIDLWTSWFAEAGVPRPSPLRGLAFDDAAMVIEAASAGLGVALVRRLHAEEALEAGRLVRVSANRGQDALPVLSGLARRQSPCRPDSSLRRLILSEFGRAGLLEAA
ncbi:MAG: LysR substrate-binding domain-containing protein [Caulobacteraceae bacterium]